MVLTFAFEIISPLLSVLAKYYVIYPFRRMMAYAAVVKTSSHKIAMQADLNALEVGSVFDASTHMAKCLALFFFAMTYSAGIPILMPVCGIAFCLFFYVDRLLLCRFYQKPPKYGDAAMKLLLRALPFAVLIRVAVSIWMLSNEDVLPRGPFDNTALPSSIEDIAIIVAMSDKYANFADMMQNYDVFGIVNLGERITRPNILPLLGLFAAIVIYLLMAFVWPRLPVHWVLSRLLNCVRQCKKNRVHIDNKGFVYNVDIMGLKVSAATTTTTTTTTTSTTTTIIITVTKLLLLLLLLPQDPLRTEISPYTGEYYKLVDYGGSNKCGRCRTSKDEITKAETDVGWKGLYKDGKINILI
jgi:hypothetical protein